MNNSAFITLPAEKYFETLLKHSGAVIISESFVLHLYISTSLTNI